jgi:cytosine/uracil/thiamine/allantoin permease
MAAARGMSREQKMLGVTVAMVVFIISLFLDWVGVSTPLGDLGSSGTDPNSWWIAVVLAIIAGGIFATDALNYPLPTRFATLDVGALAAALVFAWALFHAIDGTEGPGSLKLGAWLGLASSLVALVLAAKVWSQGRS